MPDELDGLDDDVREVGIEFMPLCFFLTYLDQGRQLDLAIRQDVFHSDDLQREVAVLQGIREVVGQAAEFIDLRSGIGDLKGADFFVDGAGPGDLVAIDHQHDRRRLAGLELGASLHSNRETPFRRDFFPLDRVFPEDSGKDSAAIKNMAAADVLFADASLLG